MTLLLLGVALAADPIPRPTPPKKVVGECDRVLSISRGTVLPGSLLSPSGSAKCSAVAVPLSDFQDLLATEKWGEATYKRYLIDVAALEMERDWYMSKYEEETKPKPFLERTGTQRWFGRLETLVTVGVVAVGLSAAYQYGSGGFK
tara:strand:+ start:170 stop:607 length:438 start_codon:yes stop_codon:yes gene_type:complete